MMRTAQDLLCELNASDESPRIEAKRAREAGKSLLETVIAFANEPGLGGGHLLLGVDWEVTDKGDARYWAAGVPDPDKLQRDLATQCASTLNVTLRPEMAVERVDGQTVVVVFVPEADVSLKPIYVAATGLPKGAYRRVGSELKPTLAGLVLFGKAVALRRLFPALRVDYVRVVGAQWVDDPEARFQSVDIRQPLMSGLPKAEAAIVDDLPKGFRLPEGELQSQQAPLLPRKVIREALANAVMHRSYQDHSPVQIVRYSNRIEILNAGFSLKDMGSLGTPGSRLRNPAIAAVLHEINWAETKGSGIRTMRRLAADAGLPLPEFASDRQKNEFKTTLFLHHLLTESDHAWLKSLTSEALSADEAKALIYARETGAVDNTACRDFSGLDTLQASNVLRRLRDRGLLEKQGAGNRTHYTLNHASERPDPHPEQGKLPLEDGKQPADGGKQALEGGKRNLPPLPALLADRLNKQGQRMPTAELRALICELCGWHPLRGEELANLLGKDLKYLRNRHLSALIQSGALVFLYPESPNHKMQAYKLPETATSD